MLHMYVCVCVSEVHMELLKQNKLKVTFGQSIKITGGCLFTSLIGLGVAGLWAKTTFEDDAAIMRAVWAYQSRGA